MDIDIDLDNNFYVIKVDLTKYFFKNTFNELKGKDVKSKLFRAKDLSYLVSLSKVMSTKGSNISQLDTNSNSNICFLEDIVSSFSLKLPHAFENWVISKKGTFILGRSVIQLFLQNLGIEPHEYEIEIGEHGKPKIVFKSRNNSKDVIYKGVEFNISHSDKYLYVIFSSFLCGIDVEKIKPLKSFVSMQEKVLNYDELLYVKTDNDDLTYDRFFEFWTIKETIGKAYGRGLGIMKEINIKPNDETIENPYLSGRLYTYNLNNESSIKKTDELQSSNNFKLTYFVGNLKNLNTKTEQNLKQIQVKFLKLNYNEQNKILEFIEEPLENQCFNEKKYIVL
jgi:phosphopantetheinyl transferase